MLIQIHRAQITTKKLKRIQKQTSQLLETKSIASTELPFDYTLLLFISTVPVSMLTMVPIDRIEIGI